MTVETTIFYQEEWRWSLFLRYLIFALKEFNCIEHEVPKEFFSKESLYGSKNNKNKVNLLTWAAKNKKINFARAVCISSKSYSVLNFLIIPKSSYNVPFFGVDFVTLPSMHLLVLDFQPSIAVNDQFDKGLLKKIIELKNTTHVNLPVAEKMPENVAKFFSPGLVWSKLPILSTSDKLISNNLYFAFKEYLNLYLKLLSESDEVDKNTKKRITTGQKLYLEYRKNNDPAKPMLNSLFGKEFTNSFINSFLFTTL
tara:strand:+ start:259 stop:1020 length:762 start_codon:yes stop_codon:yes gene_type:complete